MATTSYLGLPLYSPGDTAKLDTLLNGISTAIDTALQARLGTLLDDTGWVDISSTVTIAPGFGWGTAERFMARRQGNLVSLEMDNLAVTDGNLIRAGLSGNIQNQAMFTGIPEQFRPGTQAASGWHNAATGRVASGYISPSGSVILGALAPSSTNVTETMVSAGEAFSFSTVFFGADL